MSQCRTYTSLIILRTAFVFNVREVVPSLVPNSGLHKGRKYYGEGRPLSECPNSWKNADSHSNFELNWKRIRKICPSLGAT